MDGTVYDLYANTQLTHRALRLGAAGIGRMDDEAPVTAGLWIFYRDDPAQDQQTRVQAGDTLRVAGYQIEVLRVEAGPPARVELRLSDPPPAAQTNGHKAGTVAA
jgi:hypothetical protein